MQYLEFILGIQWVAAFVNRKNAVYFYRDDFWSEMKEIPK